LKVIYILGAALVALAFSGSAAADPAPPSQATALVGSVVGAPKAPVVKAHITSVPLAPVGFTNEASNPLPAVAASPPAVCYQTGAPGLWSQWGTYPYHQRVYEQRNWCGYLNSYQTWRQSWVTLGSVLCNNNNPRENKVGGGNGYFYTDVQSIGHFDCATNLPYVTIHVDDWQVWRCNMAGYCFATASGRL